MVKVRTKTRRMLKPQLTISRNPHDLRHPVIWCHYTLSHTTIPIHLSHLRHNNLRFASFIITHKTPPPPPSMIFDSNYRQLYHWWCPNYKEWKIIFTKKLNWKKDANWKTNNCSQIFFSLSYSLSSSPPPELSHVVTPPWGVTAACVFPAPFRAQYLLEYCFSWMRSWVRAFRFLNESFAESKKNIVIALLLISWNDETWVSANICENQTCIGVGFLQNKKHTHAHTTSWSGHNLFYRKKNPTYTNNENLISSYRISFCKPPSFS